MRSKFNLYNVYDLSGNKILANVMAKEVCSFTGLPENSKLSYYYTHNALIKGKYRIEVSSDVVEKPPRQRKPAAENICTKFTPSMLAEWRRMNERYGGRKKA